MASSVLEPRVTVLYQVSRMVGLFDTPYPRW
jgi:hypothetical protein